MDQELDSVRRNIKTVHQKEPFLGLSILCPSFLFLPLCRPVASAASRHSQENRPSSGGPGLTSLQAQGWRVKPAQTGEGVGLWRTGGSLPGREEWKCSSSEHHAGWRASGAVLQSRWTCRPERTEGSW